MGAQQEPCGNPRQRGVWLIWGTAVGLNMSKKQFPSSPHHRALAACFKARVPALIWGSPGEGKTAVVTSLIQQWGYQAEVLIGSLRDPADFAGYPHITDKDGLLSTELTAPDWAVRAANDGHVAIVLDELTTCSQSVQAAMLRLVNEGYAGSVYLGDSVRFIAMANPVDEAANGQELSPAMANRFCHLSWAFNNESWLEGFMTGFEKVKFPTLEELTTEGSMEDAARVRGLIGAYLRQNPAAIKPGVPADEEQALKAWASPRSWENLARALTFVDAEDQDAIRLLATGLIGQAASQQLVAHMRANRLVDPAKALADPKSVKWSKATPDQLYVLMSAIVVLAKNRGTRESWLQAVNCAVECINGGKPDAAIPAFIALADIRPEGVTLSQKVIEAIRPHLADQEVVV